MKRDDVMVWGFFFLFDYITLSKNSWLIDPSLYYKIYLKNISLNYYKDSKYTHTHRLSSI